MRWRMLRPAKHDLSGNRDSNTTAEIPALQLDDIQGIVLRWIANLAA